jgi:tetratricopeptide (TPR) repeat protein
VAFTGSHAAQPLTSESPTAVLLEAKSAAAAIDDRGERSAALDPVVVAQIAIAPQDARETLKAFPKLPQRLNYFTALAQAYAARGDTAETERIYADIVVEDQSSRPGKLAAANALGQLAIAYANTGNLEEAFRTLARLKERTKQEPPAIVGIATAYLAEAQARRGDVDGGVETAMTLAGENPLPLMHIVGDRVRKRNLQAAQDIVARLDDASQRYAQWGIMQVQIEQGRLIDAQVTASAIKPGHAKASALLELAAHHREHRGRPLALTLLQEAEGSARLTMNNWTRAEIFSRIAVETAMAGNSDRALSIAKSIEQDGHRSSAIYGIAQAQAKLGDFAGAFNTAGLLKQPPPTDALKVSQYDNALSDILVEMVKAGKGKEARDTTARFQNTEIRRFWLYSGIAGAYAQLGNVKEAKAALALAETDNQRRARRKELRQIEGQVRLGQTPADQTRIQELWKIDADIQRGLEAIARAVARKGDLSGAMAVTDELNQPTDRLRLIKDLATLHVEAGQRKDTFRWARTLAGPSEKVFALVGIAIALSHEADKRKSKPASARKIA